MDIESSGWTPDIIVGIANGGVIPATLLSKQWNIPVRTVIIQLRDGNIQERNHDVEIAIRHNKRVLFVDDINDSGSTLQHIKHTWYIKKEHWGDTVRTAVIHNKNTSKTKPDYKAEDVESSSWVVYPWEV